MSPDGRDRLEHNNFEEEEFLMGENTDLQEEQIHPSREIESDAIETSGAYTVTFDNEEIFVDSIDWRDSRRLKCQILSAFFVYMLFGMAEQTVGTLIPEFQKYYDINYVVTSYIYLTNTLGYLSMAVLNEFCNKYFGMKGIVIIGTSAMTITYFVVSLRPPFFLLVSVYLLNGLGFGALDSGVSTWMGNLVNSNSLLGILHGCYGIGCMISPPLITYLLERPQNPWIWSDYYILLLAVSGLVLLVFTVTFKYETAKKYLYVTSMKKQQEQDIQLKNMSQEAHEIVEDEVEVDTSTLMIALKSKLVWVLCMVLFFYVGSEVAFGQWLITYLMRTKGLKYKASSYIVTSFWTGLTLGRMVLGFVTDMYFSSELMANLFYISGSFVGFFLFWIASFTNFFMLYHFIVFVAGVAIGPIFPTTIVASMKVIPVNIQTSAVGFICAFGGGGGAAIPFMIGVLAQTINGGLESLPFITVFIYGVLGVVWYLLYRRFRSKQKNRL